MLYLVFRHPTELAALMHELWNTIFYNRVTEAMLDVSVSAIFISAEAGGMENEPLEEVFGAEFQYHEVFFVLNLMKLTPVCFIESLTIIVERKGAMTGDMRGKLPPLPLWVNHSVWNQGVRINPGL